MTRFLAPVHGLISGLGKSYNERDSSTPATSWMLTTAAGFIVTTMTELCNDAVGVHCP